MINQKQQLEEINQILFKTPLSTCAKSQQGKNSLYYNDVHIHFV